MIISRGFNVFWMGDKKIFKIFLSNHLNYNNSHHDESFY